MHHPKKQMPQAWDHDTGKRLIKENGDVVCIEKGTTSLDQAWLNIQPKKRRKQRSHLSYSQCPG